MNIKSVFCAILMLAATTAQSQTFELFGHWPAGLVNGAKGHFKVNDATFTVSDWKISNFIKCASKKYPKTELFIEGIEDSESGSSVATAAYLCKGEIRLSSCQDTDKQWFCE